MDENSHKRFSSCRISWKIQNFCFACRPDNYTVFSPEFILQGINSVKWRMSLELEYDELSKHSLVSFYLEKSNILELKNLYVNWEVTLTAGNRIFGPYEKSSEFGELSKHCQIGITTTDKILDSFFPLKSDTLTIHLYFIAFDKEKPLKLIEEPARGLFLLSEDLRRLKDAEESYTDIKVKAIDKPIEAHKAILSCNEIFETYINKAKSDSIEISKFDYKILDEFVHFLYSGNVEYLLNDPSISLLRCLEHFKCDAVKPYFSPEELTMHSKIKVEKHEFQWLVADILDRNAFVFTSPPIKRLNINTTWKLTISLDSDVDNYISIFAEITDGELPSYFCLEFAILNEAGEAFFPRRLIRNNKDYDSMGFKYFVEKDSLYEKALMTDDDCVRFLFRIRTSDGTPKSSMRTHMVCFVSSTEAKSYKQLSERTSELLKSKKYSDIALKCKNKTIKAHKCILVSRSPEFKRRIDNESSDNILILRDIEPDTLENIINYMYSGILEDLGGCEMLNLYYASVKTKLNIPSLKEESLKILRERKTYILDL